MTSELEFCLLGPLLVRRKGTLVPVQQGKQRAVLAALVLRAGTRVSVDEFAEILWGSEPPPSARATIQNYVMRLRKALGAADGSRIATRPGGYLLRADAAEVDVTRFEALLGTARAAARDGAWDTAAAAAGAALELWRGDPLADVDCELLAVREVPRLAELRLQAQETRIEADLHLGRHAEVIAELGRLTAVHPLRERLHGLLMLALYRDGRQAEALASYQQARRVLTEELGTEPGAALRDLHQRILTGDLALDRAGSPAAIAGGTDGVTPRELPGAVPQFTGRTTEMDTLTRLLDQPGPAATRTAVITAIGGTAGVGKTALAVNWAHHHADRFPDGQLYVNLRGYDPGQPVPAADALARFLRALGVPGPGIPADPDERAARYRSLLAGRRMLIVLDNAGSAEQVRPLLPGSAGCAVIVTSRDSLAGLVARDGAVRLDLDLLPQPEAVGLLDRLIGDRARGDPQAAEALADRCCRLPLALRVASELAVTRPATPLAGLVDELADRQQRLGLLDAAGDPRTAVRAVFSWSYRHLDPDAARAFRLAALHPGPDLDAYAVAALAGLNLDQARRALDALGRAHLVQAAGQDRHALHDLLRAYGRELAAEDGETGQREAMTRLLDFCLTTAAGALDVLAAEDRHRRPAVPPPAAPAPRLDDRASAWAWLDAERPALVAITVHAADSDWPAHAWKLAAILYRYLDDNSYCAEGLIVHGCAAAAARQAGDQAAEGTALNHLAGVHWRQGRFDEAASCLQQSLARHRAAGDHARQGNALANLALIHFDRGSYAESLRLNEQAMRIFTEVADRPGRVHVLNHIGNVEEREGRYDRAIRHFEEALAIAGEIGAQHSQCVSLVNLGIVALRQDRLGLADARLHRALALCRDLRYRHGEAEALARLGDVRLRQGRYREAAHRVREAITMFREIGNQAGEAGARSSLGEILLAFGQSGRARDEHVTALALADLIGEKFQQARAYAGLGDACHAAGDPAAARAHWQEALARYADLGIPDADRVRDRLAAAGDRPLRLAGRD